MAVITRWDRCPDSFVHSFRGDCLQTVKIKIKATTPSTNPGEVMDESRPAATHAGGSVELCVCVMPTRLVGTPEKKACLD